MRRKSEGWGVEVEAESLRGEKTKKMKPLDCPGSLPHAPSSGARIQHASTEGFPQCCDALGHATTGCLHHAVAGAGSEGQD